MGKNTKRKGPTFDAKESAEIARRYNICNAILGQRPGEVNVDDGYERELSREIELREGVNSRGACSLHVPYAALRGVINGVTDVAGEITGNGAALIPTNLLDNFSISPLAARCVVARAGAVVLDGMREGDLAIPKAGTIEPSWIDAEGQVVPEVNPNYSQLVGTVHTCAARVDLTRKMTIQTSPAAQAFLLAEIMRVLTRAVDVAALAGTGEDGQPTGIVNAAGVAAVEEITPGRITAANIEAFIDAVTDADADEEALTFIAPTAVKKALRNLRRAYVEVKDGDNTVAVVGGELVCKNRAMFDVPFLASNVAPAKKLICGDFSQLMLCGWGGDSFDIQVNPYTLAGNGGGTRVNVYKDVDVIVRNPDAFAVGTILA